MNSFKFSILSSCLFFKLFAAPFPLVEVDSIYKDHELETLWNSIEDINNPTLEDYLAVENHLKYGQRPYLDGIFTLPCIIKFCEQYNITEIDRSHAFNNRILQKLRLVSVNQEMPRFLKMTLGNASPEDLSRCIVFYVSYNDSPHPFDTDAVYYNKVCEVIEDLKSEGYNGHVLFRVGGYPLTDRGGLRLAHVPYSFKVMSIIEASLFGYENVLWLDSTIHPTNNLDSVFEKIAEEGVFLLGSAMCDYAYQFGLLSESSLKYSSVSVEDLSEIYEISAAAIGVSFNSFKGHDLIREWYRLTMGVYPAMTLYPEQFLLSVAAWRCGLKPSESFIHHIYLRSAIPTRPINDLSKSFWFDKG